MAPSAHAVPSTTAIYNFPPEGSQFPSSGAPPPMQGAWLQTAAAPGAFSQDIGRRLDFVYGNQMVTITANNKANFNIYFYNITSYECMTNRSFRYALQGRKYPGGKDIEDGNRLCGVGSISNATHRTYDYCGESFAPTTEYYRRITGVLDEVRVLDCEKDGNKNDKLENPTSSSVSGRCFLPKFPVPGATAPVKGIWKGKRVVELETAKGYAGAALISITSGGRKQLVAYSGEYLTKECLNSVECRKTHPDVFIFGNGKVVKRHQGTGEGVARPGSGENMRRCRQK